MLSRKQNEQQKDAEGKKLYGTVENAHGRIKEGLQCPKCGGFMEEMLRGSGEYYCEHCADDYKKEGSKLVIQNAFPYPMCDCGHSQDKHAGSSHEDGCTVCNCPSFEFDLGNSGVKDQFKNVPCSKGGVHDWEPVPSSGNNKDMKCAKCGMGLDQIKVADTDKQLSNAFGARARNQELAKEGAKKFGPRE